jgi:hypothetical protein
MTDYIIVLTWKNNKFMNQCLCYVILHLLAIQILGKN